MNRELTWHDLYGLFMVLEMVVQSTEGLSATDPVKFTVSK